jgi:hypothetical protein
MLIHLEEDLLKSVLRFLIVFEKTIGQLEQASLVAAYELLQGLDFTPGQAPQQRII